ncbi:MAG: hypothetical protein IKO41_14180 [Lachnospiraceae bacterium]|nr:hypothetical protein [Lachnospiraceae bacterium]
MTPEIVTKLESYICPYCGDELSSQIAFNLHKYCPAELTRERLNTETNKLIEENLSTIRKYCAIVCRAANAPSRFFGAEIPLKKAKTMQRADEDCRVLMHEKLCKILGFDHNEFRPFEDSDIVTDITFEDCERYFWNGFLRYCVEQHPEMLKKK